MTFLPPPHTLTSRNRQVMRAAGLTDARGRAAWDELRPGFDPDAFTFNEKQLLPRLALNLEVLDPDFAGLDRLQGLRRHAWAGNQRALEDAVTVTQALATGGIDAALIGAGAATVTLDPEPGLRRVNAPLLLVQPHEWLAAVARTERGGWTAVPFHYRVPNAIVYVQRCSRDGHDILVLSAPATALRRTNSAGESTLWSDMVSVDVQGTQMRTLGPAEALVTTSAYARTSHGPLGLLPIADVDALARRDDLDWNRVVRCAREQHVTRVVLEVLAFARDVFATPVPTEAQAALDAVPLSARDRVVHRLRTTPEYRVPVVGGALDSVGRSVVQTAHLPPTQAVPVAVEILAGRWGVGNWREILRVLATKASTARARGR